METTNGQSINFLKKYYIFSVLFGLAMSLVGVYMARFGEAQGIIAALFWVIVFISAYLKREKILESKWKWVVLTLSTLFLVGTIVSMITLFN